MESNHIVVVGGGFAGVEAAIALRKKDYKVTLISNRDYMFIYPISIWIPVDKITFAKSSLSLHKLAKKHRFEVIIDNLFSINPAENKVELQSQNISYDYLVIATGAGKIHHPGIEHTYSICGQPEQAIELKKRFETLQKNGSGKIAIGFGGNPKDKSAVRGGPAFELLFNFIHTLKQKRILNNFEFTFFAPMEEPGKRMGKSGYQMLDKLLKKYSINKQVGEKIVGFEQNGIRFENDIFIESDMTMFIPASNGPKYLLGSMLPLNDAGFIKIDDTCKVEHHNNIYAVGDITAMEGPDWKAKQGHMAVVMGKNAAYNIDQQIKGTSKRKGYKEHINILCVMDTGNGAAYVYRKGDKDFVIPLPIIGHWMKIVWGLFYKFTKTVL